jgi:SAM-dependent methyltransferase
MMRYYQNAQYHTAWIKGINANWRQGTHDAQLAMCKLIWPESVIVEAGCGDGSSASEIKKRIERVRYFGVDLNPMLWGGQATFAAARAEQLPFPTASVDVVLSMFMIEHLVFPSRFLDEAWRILRPGGNLITVAPDFSNNPMASERVGLSYGSGRHKVARGKFMDACLTAYDTRVRISALRHRRKHEIRSGICSFPILMHPRCLYLPGFTPDCDAIYPACPEEITTYMRMKPGYRDSNLFYRDNSTFGLLIAKLA